MSDQIVLASGNNSKIAEIQSILPDRIIIPQSHFDVPEVEETGLTFLENAIIKVRNACQYTCLPAVADDSGIEVDALGGQPGVRSARYAGEPADDQKNLEKLLAQMEAIPDSRRTARFRCVIVFMRDEQDPSPIIGEGVWEGSILRQPIGNNGFGYDPIFFLAQSNCSSAQLRPEIKNRLSHRAQALAELMKKLE